MTCIAGCIDERGTIYMGGDSAVTGADLLMVCTESKVFQKETFLLGCCGEMRVLQLLKYAFTPPVYDPKNMSIEQYMTTIFIQKIRHCFSKASYNEKGADWSALIGFQGRLFTIDDEYQIGEAACRYDAIGSGSDIAKGALYATAELKPYERIKRALAAAEEHIQSVRNPFIIEKLEPLIPHAKASLLQRFKPKTGPHADALREEVTISS